MINCPKCGEELEDGATFCTNCGEKLTVSCPKCGKALKPGAKFCSGCGTNLAEFSDEEEKPTVCPNCGAELDEDATFCDQCGKSVKSLEDCPLQELFDLERKTHGAEIRWRIGDCISTEMARKRMRQRPLSGLRNLQNREILMANGS